MGQILLLVLGVQVGEEDQAGSHHEELDHSHATTLPAAGTAPPRLPKATCAGNQRMALWLRGDRFLHLLQHRRPQKAGGSPLIAAASDDASHEVIIRLCRIKRQGQMLRVQSSSWGSLRRPGRKRRPCQRRWPGARGHRGVSVVHELSRPRKQGVPDSGVDAPARGSGGGPRVVEFCLRPGRDEP
jgi:hypothetical protein